MPKNKYSKSQYAFYSKSTQIYLPHEALFKRARRKKLRKSTRDDETNGTHTEADRRIHRRRRSQYCVRIRKKKE